MNNPFTARRRRFVAETMAAAEASADERAQAIADAWIRDANRRAGEAENRATVARTEADDRMQVLAVRIAELRDRCRELAETNRAHSGDCAARMHTLELLTRVQAERLAELQRANEDTYPPIGIDLQAWSTAIEETRTRLIAEKAAAAKALVTAGEAA